MWAPIKSSKSKNRRNEQSPPRSGARELLSPFLFWIGAAAVMAGILAAYSPSLNYPFILDDNLFIGDRRIQYPGHVGEHFASAAWAQFAGGLVSFYRPVFVLWLRLCGVNGFARASLEKRHGSFCGGATKRTPQRFRGPESGENPCTGGFGVGCGRPMPGSDARLRERNPAIPG